MDQNINDSKSCVWKSFLENIICSIQLFYIRSNIPVDIRVVFDIRFSSRKSQSQQKLAKKISHFTIQFRSKNLTHFMNLNSLDVENNMLPQHSQKPFWLKIFLANMFLFGVRKNLCTTPFLDAQELHSLSSSKANACIFLYISIRYILFQRRSKILSSGGSLG